VRVGVPTLTIASAVLWKASLGTSPEPHRATIRADSGGKSARIDMAQAIEVDVAGRPADAPRFLLFMLARDSYFVCWQLPAEVRSCLLCAACAACSVCADCLMESSSAAGSELQTVRQVVRRLYVFLRHV
jgi:hypothetical protein